MGEVTRAAAAVRPACRRERRSLPAAATVNAPAPAPASRRRAAPTSISGPPSSPAATAADYAHDRAFRTEIAVCDDGYIYETVRSHRHLPGRLDGARDVRGRPVGAAAHLLAALEAEAADSPIGAGGVVVLPYWQGCMTPYWDPYARGVIAGLSGSTRRGDDLSRPAGGHRAGGSRPRSMNRRSDRRSNRSSSLPSAAVRTAISGCRSWPMPRAARWSARRPWRPRRSAPRSRRPRARAGIGPSPRPRRRWSGPPVRTFEPNAGTWRAMRELRAIHAELWPKLAEWNARLASFTEGAADEADCMFSGGRGPSHRLHPHRHRRHADHRRPALRGFLCRAGKTAVTPASPSCPSPAGRPAGAT